MINLYHPTAAGGPRQMGWLQLLAAYPVQVAHLPGWFIVWGVAAYENAGMLGNLVDAMLERRWQEHCRFHVADLDRFVSGTFDGERLN